MTQDEYIDQLIANDNYILAQAQIYRDANNFMIALTNWRNNSLQDVGKGVDPGPRPIPPAGFNPPPDPVSDLNLAVSSRSHTPVVGALNQFGQYPSGDDYPAGAKINWFGQVLVKVIRSTPFGNSQWWEVSS